MDDSKIHFQELKSKCFLWGTALDPLYTFAHCLEIGDHLSQIYACKLYDNGGEVFNCIVHINNFVFVVLDKDKTIKENLIIFTAKRTN